MPKGRLTKEWDPYEFGGCMGLTFVYCVLELQKWKKQSFSLDFGYCRLIV